MWFSASDISSVFNSTCFNLFSCLQLFINLNTQAKTLVSLFQLENLLGCNLHEFSADSSTFTRVAIAFILLYFRLSSLLLQLSEFPTISSCGHLLLSKG